MQFKTAFAILVSLSVGLNGYLGAALTVQINEKQAQIRNDIQKLISDVKARHDAAPHEGEHDLMPALEALIGLIDLAAAIELINYESGCGAEMWEYLRSPAFEEVIDDFWGESGILGVLEFIATNGFEFIYDMIGLLHLLMGLKLPDLPYTEERLRLAVAPAYKVADKAVAAVALAEDECTPEDQEAIAEIVSRVVPIWKMLDVILDLLATDESFVALIMRVREPDVIASYQSFIAKDSAIDLGHRMELIGVPPNLILAVWNLFFGLYEKP